MISAENASPNAMRRTLLKIIWIIVNIVGKNRKSRMIMDFLEIYEIIEKAMDTVEFLPDPDIDDILSTETRTRSLIEGLITMQ